MKSLVFAFVLASTPAYAIDRVSLYDYDKDGKVSFEDINRYCTVPRALFKAADKNNDKFLTNGEMSTARRYLFSRCQEVPK